MSSAAIATEGLTKFYGSTKGLDGLDLEVPTGQVFGYLGPNGAGKTTTIRLLLDLIRPTSGRAEVLGLDPWSDAVEVQRRVGYLPGELALYDDMTAEQFLGYFLALRDAKGSGYAHELAERFDLDVSRRIGTLSKGNKQKVGLVQAFMHRPELLLLDEPTSGLDPLVQQEFHRVLKETIADGRTVFLSSHVLSEIEELADQAAIIRGGSLVALEDISELKAKAARRVSFHFAAPVASESFESIPEVKEALIDGDVATFVVEGSIDKLLKVAARYEVIDVFSREPDLEDVFLSYYQESP